LHSNASQKRRGRPRARAHPHFSKNFPKPETIFVLLIGFMLLQTIHFSPPLANASGSTYAVDIVDYAFQPLHINITTGTTVTWTYVSSGATIHTVTSDPGTNQSQTGTPLINSGDLSPGQSFSYAFYQPGYYPYQCAVHPTIPKMNGWVMVTGNPVTSPSPNNGPGNSWLLPAVIVALAGTLAIATWTLVRHGRYTRSQTSSDPLTTIRLSYCLEKGAWFEPGRNV